MLEFSVDCFKKNGIEMPNAEDGEFDLILPRERFKNWLDITFAKRPFFYIEENSEEEDDFDKLEKDWDDLHLAFRFVYFTPYGAVAELKWDLGCVAWIRYVNKVGAVSFAMVYDV